MSQLTEQLDRLNSVYCQKGGGIPFSAMEDTNNNKYKKIRKIKRNNKRTNKRINKRINKRTKKRTNKRTTKKTNKCKCGSHYYTGKEHTPRGLGKCEECIPSNVIMKGKDGSLYENKNNQWIPFNQNYQYYSF